MALDLPGATETDVGDTDGEPGEECAETREGDEPVKDGRADVGKVDVGEGGKGEDEDERPEGATGLVNKSEDLGRVASLGEGSESTRAGVDTRQTDGEHRDTNGDVDQVVHALDVGLVHDDNEGGDIGAGTVEEAVVVVGNEKADDNERRDVLYQSANVAWTEHLLTIRVIRQKVFLTAEGMVLRGLGVSVAARPTSSVPANEKAAVTNTAQTPLKPLANAPGFCHKAPPM